MVRTQLRALLERQDEWVVVGEAWNGRDAVEKFQEHKPNITVMDLQMPAMNGLEAARQLTQREPDVPILMVTLHPSKQLEKEAKKAGVRGLCRKSHIRCLVHAIEDLLRGGTHFHVGRRLSLLKKSYRY
jgi:DNA-binding NarL/FixJ family response regulator